MPLNYMKSPWDNWAQKQYGLSDNQGLLDSGTFGETAPNPLSFLTGQQNQAPYATPFGANSLLGGGGLGAGVNSGGGSIWDSFLSKEGKQGWGNPAIAIAGGLTNAFLGMKQYGLAKKTFDESKRQFELNYDAQRNLTNSQLEDRQRARVASNGNYQSVEAYMDKNRVK